MPAKKAAKITKVQAKVANKKSVAPKSASKSVSKSVPKNVPKVTKVAPKSNSKSLSKSVPKVTKIAPKVDIKANDTPAYNAKYPRKSLGKDNKKMSTPKKAPEPVSLPLKGRKRDEPAKVEPVVVPKKDDKVDDKIKKTKSQQQIVKVITKGGAAVDSFVLNSGNYRVLVDGGKVYSATLNQSNLDANNNKFYIIQILVHETTGAIHVWNRWGRVGVPGQNALKGPMDKMRAISDYNSKHHEKTVKGDYRQIQIKYDDQKQQKKQQQIKTKGPKKEVKSKMDQELQRLINLIFDINVMNNTMKQIGYDAKRMPLGKLGDSTIKQAYGILNKLSQAIKNKKTDQYKSLSSEFYTLIPHDFGFQKMANFVLDNDQKVKQKIKMLQTISDMKITTKLLQQKSNDQDAVLDQNYKKLGCQIKTVKNNTPDYKQLIQYFDNTKGHYSKVKISDIYQVVRPTEQKQFNTKIGNNMLLWHGSRLSNFVGILSQGLRIAPPEAPVSGYLFGKGIYLADMAEKSINYCRSGGSNTALILLIQGAIGDPNILLSSSYQAKELMEKNKKHSTKCHGSKAPPQSSYTKLKGTIVPKGKPVPTGSGSYMGHNQFIVYNMNQARIKYILRMDMNGN